MVTVFLNSISLLCTAFHQFHFISHGKFLSPTNSHTKIKINFETKAFHSFPTITSLLLYLHSLNSLSDMLLLLLFLFTLLLLDSQIDHDKHIVLCLRFNFLCFFFVFFMLFSQCENYHKNSS